MGLILDTSILIASERGGVSVQDMLYRARAHHGETDVGLSAVSAVELTHGIYRAKSERTVNVVVSMLKKRCTI